MFILHRVSQNSINLFFNLNEWIVFYHFIINLKKIKIVIINLCLKIDNMIKYNQHISKQIDKILVKNSMPHYIKEDFIIMSRTSKLIIHQCFLFYFFINHFLCQDQLLASSKPHNFYIVEKHTYHIGIFGKSRANGTARILILIKPTNFKSENL